VTNVVRIHCFHIKEENHTIESESAGNRNVGVIFTEENGKGNGHIDDDIIEILAGMHFSSCFYFFAMFI
jgi:hypothetical protein